MDLNDHLFRREAGRMIAALTRIFGVHNLGLAEDVVQEAFCRAAEIWKFRGVPENPSAWLMATAKNCALDALRRQRTARQYAPELGRYLESEWTRASVLEEQFGATAIKDDLLRMMFSCCDPRLAEEGQIALVLHILCGFSVGEIAGAFVSSQAAIEKRITRAKKVLAHSKNLFDVAAAAEFSARLPAVQRALYLLFNEGYHGACAEAAIRAELCREAMRLAAELLAHPHGRKPASYALAALMAFGAARLAARADDSGALLSLIDQDRSLWDQTLIDEGLRLLEQSASGDELTTYHLEAAIAAAHARAPSVDATDWATIVSLYDAIMAIRPSPIVALNRAIAIAERDGPDQGREALEAIEDRDRLAKYPFYPAALGEIALRRGESDAAAAHFRAALKLARNHMERGFLERRIGACDAPLSR